MRLMTVSPDRNLRPEVHRIGPMSLAPDVVSSLPNGITLHIVDGGVTEVCRIGVALPGGVAECERPADYDAVSNLLPEGSLHTPGSRLAEILETNGAWVVPTVTSHHTVVNVFSLCTVFPAILRLVREMVFEPEMSADAVARVTGALSTRYAVNRRKVDYMATRALYPAIYGEDNPLARTADPDEILSFTPDSLLALHARRLDSRGIHIYLAGRVTAEMVEAVAKEFGGIDTGARFEIETPVFDPDPLPREVFTPMDDALQNGVKIAIPVPGRNNPDFLRMRIAVCALGGYFGSRLMTNIREEKGLTYGINASLYGYPDNGYLIISTQTACENTRRVIDESVREIERLKDPSTFTPEEMGRLISHQLSGLAAVLDTPFQRMDFLQNTLLASTPPDYFARQYEVVTTATAENIAATAARYFDTGRVVTSVAGKEVNPN